MKTPGGNVAQRDPKFGGREYGRRRMGRAKKESRRDDAGDSSWPV